LGHPNATITSVTLTSGDATQWKAQAVQQYDPYPTLVTEALVSYFPNKFGTFSAIVQINLSDGATFGLQYVATGAP
jgi:hypothetical protein